MLKWTVLVVAFVAGSCFAQPRADRLVYVASTPCDAGIKSVLTIPVDLKCDFIRWELTLNAAPKTFSLGIIFGQGEPNTPGFRGGGQRLSFTGRVEIEKREKREIYLLKSTQPATQVSLIKINENLFHILTPESRLMVGTGGWSYTINRQEPVTQIVAALATNGSTKAPAAQMVFVGRTPCREIEWYIEVPPNTDCPKIKWKLTLFSDPVTKEPTTYTLSRTLHRSSLIEGKWRITRGDGANFAALVYQLDPDKPERSISLALADQDLLLFLDKNGRPLTGNADFSYTLNRTDK